MSVQAIKPEEPAVGSTEERPWGASEVLAEGPLYRVKRLTIMPGKRISLQHHQHRCESWVIVSGTGILETFTQPPHPPEMKPPPPERVVVHLEPPGTFMIGANQKHRVGCWSGTEPLVIIEVQYATKGRPISESDIIRLEDDFGRPTSR